MQDVHHRILDIAAVLYLGFWESGLLTLQACCVAELRVARMVPHIDLNFVSMLQIVKARGVNRDVHKASSNLHPT